MTTFKKILIFCFVCSIACIPLIYSYSQATVENQSTVSVVNGEDALIAIGESYQYKPQITKTIEYKYNKHGKLIKDKDDIKLSSFKPAIVFENHIGMTLDLKKVTFEDPNLFKNAQLIKDGNQLKIKLIPKENKIEKLTKKINTQATFYFKWDNGCAEIKTNLEIDPQVEIKENGPIEQESDKGKIESSPIVEEPLNNKLNSSDETTDSNNEPNDNSVNANNDSNVDTTDKDTNVMDGVETD